MTAYNAVIATIVVASDASSVTKAMVNSTTWRAGTSGDWLSTSCTLSAGNTYQFRTVNSSFSSNTATLPNIKASVTVDWDISGTVITTIGNSFLKYYAHSCSLLTSLSVPDTSSITTIGNSFMRYYARGCTSLTSLSVPDTSSVTTVGDYFMGGYIYNCTFLTFSVPDTSSLTSIGDYFMSSYADSCSSLTSLDVPDTSSITTVGGYFMYAYANYCSSLTSLSVPDTSSLTSAGTSFMGYYAGSCTSLTRLELPAVGWFETHNIDWKVPSGRLGILKGYVKNSTDLSDWQALTDTSGETLYTNYIRSTANVIYPIEITTQAVTSINSITATGNGNIISGPNATSRGFCYKAGTTGDPTTSDSTAYDTGTYSSGAYTKGLTLLSVLTSYRLRAYASDSAGTYYGTTVNFKTLKEGFSNPTDAYTEDGSFATTPADDGIIYVSLSKDGGTTWTSELSKTFDGTNAYLTFGDGDTELWGTTFTGDDVDDTSFRLKIRTKTTAYQIYKTFGFAITASYLLTGIEVKVKAKWITDTTSIDVIEVKIYYGTSTLPIQAGSQVYASDGRKAAETAGNGTGVLTFYDGSNWIASDSGTTVAA